MYTNTCPWGTTKYGLLEKGLNSPAFHAGIQGFESPTGHYFGRLAQLGERLPYKQDVGGSIPSTPIQMVLYSIEDVDTVPFFLFNLHKKMNIFP